MNFNNKVVLITGASSGIGACTAEHFARFNAKLALFGRDKDRLTGVMRKCIKYVKEESIIYTYVADITIDAEKMIEQVINKFGKLDILINNAGIMELGSIENSTMAQYDEVMKTNVRAVFELTKYAVPHLIKTKGNIVNVSSVAGVRSFDNMIIYGMSKAALDQFTRCMSLDLASKKVRINSVNPAMVKTNLHLNSGMDEKTYNEYIVRAAKLSPLGRCGEPCDIANAILFLANDVFSNFITGAIVPIDGGKFNQSSH